MIRAVYLVALFSMVVAFPSNVAEMKHSQLPNDSETMKGQHPNLHNLGRVGNKFYFVERDTGNWTASKLYCESLGMTLGSIDTDQERDFLASKYESGVFHGWHWTAARDSQTLKQFIWDDNNSEVTVSMPLQFDFSDAIDLGNQLTCGAYVIRDTGAGMSFIACSNPNGYALCESE